MKPRFYTGILVLAFTAAVHPFAGCGTGGRADDPDAGKRGGKAVISSYTKPDVLNPILTSSTASVHLFPMIFNGLTKLNRDLSPAPDLAERWEMSQDGLTYTFHLRQGVKFHDGVAFTAEDVKFTYEKVKDPKIGSSQHVLESVERVEVIDPYTVRLTLNRINPRLLTNAVTYPIVPKHILEGAGDLTGLPFNRHPVGTGLFKFAGWTADSTRIVLTANEHYFEGRPYLDTLMVWTGMDQSELWAGLMRQEVDVMPSLTPEDMEFVKVDSMTFNLYSAPYPFYYMLLYNHDDPRFADPRVRRAFSFGLDRQAIIDRALLGYGTIATGPFFPDSWASDPDIRPVPYDPLKALQLLADAGWADHNGDDILDRDGKPFEVTMLVDSGDKTKEQTALVLRQQLQEIGIKIRLERMDAPGLMKKRMSPGKFEMVIMQYNATDPSIAGVFWHSSNIGPSRYNWAHYRNAEVDSLLDLGNVTPDPEARKRLYRRIHVIMAEDQPAAFLFFKNQFEAVNRRIGGVESGWGYNIYSSVRQWHLVPRS